MVGRCGAAWVGARREMCREPRGRGRRGRRRHRWRGRGWDCRCSCWCFVLQWTEATTYLEVFTVKLAITQSCRAQQTVANKSRKNYSWRIEQEEDSKEASAFESSCSCCSPVTALLCRSTSAHRHQAEAVQCMCWPADGRGSDSRLI